MALGVVAVLKNGELVTSGVVGGDCRDKMADKYKNGVLHNSTGNIILYEV